MTVGRSHFPCFRIAICKSAVIKYKSFAQPPLLVSVLEESLNTLIGSKYCKYNGVQTQKIKRLGKDLKQLFLTTYLQWFLRPSATGDN